MTVDPRNSTRLAFLCDAIVRSPTEVRAFAEITMAAHPSDELATCTAALVAAITAGKFTKDESAVVRLTRLASIAEKMRRSNDAGDPMAGCVLGWAVENYVACTEGVSTLRIVS